ncbi:MAG: class I SAM-dependent methyltransferase [Acidobacteriota bacterium]
MPTQREAGSFTFDQQAGSFDRRAGLPAAAAQRAAEAVCELAGVDGLVIDIGAGTGEVGSQLARGPCRYLGIDISLPMLRAFRHKLGTAEAGLLRADAGRPWPVAVGCASVIFSSRAAHLIDSAHLVAETLRVARPEAATLVIGRVQRPADSVRVELRREMRRLLARSGVEGRGGRRAGERLMRALEAAGGQRLPAQRVASWEVTERPADALRAWRDKPGLAGRAVSPTLKNDILRRLEAWSQKRLGELTLPRRTAEYYELLAVRLSRQRGD